MNGQEKSDNERTIIELRERARVRRVDIFYIIYIIYITLSTLSAY